MQAHIRYTASRADAEVRQLLNRQVLEHGLPLDAPGFATFYAPGPKGYTNHPAAT